VRGSNDFKSFFVKQFSKVVLPLERSEVNSFSRQLI